MRRIIKFLITLLVGAGIFWLIMRNVGWGKVIEAATLFLSFKGLIIILLTFLVAAVSILRWKLILKSQGLAPPLKELGKLWSVGFAISYLTPIALLGGEPFRVYFSKKKLNLSWEKSAASVVIDKILDGTFALIFVIVGVSAFLFYGYFPGIIWIVTLIIIGLLSLLFLFYFKSLRKESALEWLLKFLGIKKEAIENNENSKILFDTEREVIRFFSPKRKTFWQGLELSFLRYLLLFSRAAILTFFLAGVVGLPKALVIYGFSTLALLFPLPAALGSLEAAGAFSFGTLGFGFATGTIFSMVWRNADLFLCLIGIFFLIKLGLNLAEIKILDVVNKFRERS